MEDLVNQSAVDHLFQVFALATALIVFWFIESIWRLNRKWMIPIVIFPCSIFLFIFVYWEESRAKCFFATLLLIVMLLVGGLVGHNFFEQILAMFTLIAFWPYYLYAFVASHLSSV